MFDNNTYKYSNSADGTYDLTKFDIFIIWLWFLLGLSSFVVEVLFIILKVSGVLNWAWWIVFSPMWGFNGILILTLCFIFLVGYITEFFDKKKVSKIKSK